MKSKRQAIQYIIGLLILALGSVLMKKAALGMTPVTSIPAAVATVAPLSLGTSNTLFHFLCVFFIVIIQRKMDLKTALIIPLSVVFGWIVDGYMFLLNFGQLSMWARLLLCLCGVVTTALGIVIIVGCRGLLPAPDALFRTTSAVYNIPLSKVKTVGDAVFSAVALLLDLIFSYKLFLSVGLGTVLAVLLAGRLVGVFTKKLPWLTLDLPVAEVEKE